MNALRTLVLFVATLIGCLPEDTREEPGALSVTIRGTDATVDGFDTTDGWHVSFDRVLVSVGAPQLGRESSCSPYSDGDYLRVIDGRHREPEKLGLLYGLGTCGLELFAGNPGREALLGAAPLLASPRPFIGIAAAILFFVIAASLGLSLSHMMSSAALRIAGS